MKRLDEISGRPWLAGVTWGLVVLLVLTLHLFQNGIEIGHRVLWLDEASTWGVAHHGFWRVFTLPSEFHSQPPLYYLLLHFIMKLGSTEWLMRGLSWLCGAGTLLFVLVWLDELSLLARLVFAALYLFTSWSRFLAQELRPYGLASLLMLIQVVLFLRLMRAPTRRRAWAYVVVTFLALHALSFDVWSFATEGLIALGLVIAGVARLGLRASIARHRELILGVVASGLSYVPFFLLVWHYQHTSGRGNPTWKGALIEATRSEHFVAVLGGFVPLSAPWAAIPYTLALAALIVGVWSRRAEVLVLPALVLVHIAAVYGFLYGRSFMADRYFTPVWAIFLLLVALGVDAIVRSVDRRAWVALVCGLAYWAWALQPPFVAYRHAPLPKVGWRAVGAALRAVPNRKVVFFDAGYEGQMLAYETRHDRDVDLRLRVTSLWGAGGDMITPEYIVDTIRETADSTRCYYYVVNNGAPTAPFHAVFEPEMKRRDYLPEPGPGGGLNAFCKAREP